jgi:hypothetical protein
MSCGWTITSTSRITYIDVEVTFSSGGYNLYKYGVIPAEYKIWNTAEEYIDIPGDYYALLEGTVTTFDGVYELVPGADEVYMN